MSRNLDVKFFLLLVTFVFSLSLPAFALNNNCPTALQSCSTTCSNYLSSNPGAACYCKLEVGSSNVAASGVVTEYFLVQLCGALHPDDGPITCGNSAGCSEDAPAPAPAPPLPPVDKRINECGSIVHAYNQTVGEAVPIVGTPMDLTYFSDRVRGRLQAYEMTIPLTGTTVDSSITAITLTLTIAGVTTTQTFSPPTANLSYNFVWSGLDNNGNVVPATASLNVSIDYVGYTTAPIQYTNSMGVYRSDLLGLGGWVPSFVHFYDKNGGQIYYGDGNSRTVTASLYNNSTQYIAGNDDGSELYIFDLNGKHLQTLNGLTGAVLYSFAYDSLGHLTTITDAYSNQTTVIRDPSGNLTGIQGSYGQTTQFTLDANGYIATITNPNNETYSMTYMDAGGLLHTFQKPRGQIGTMSYVEGLLLNDSNSAGNSIGLLGTMNGANSVITSTSAMSLSTQYSTSYSTNSFSRTTTFPDLTVERTTWVANVSESDSSPSVSSASYYETDPRLGSIANLVYSSNKNGWSDSVSKTIPSWTQTGPAGNPNYFNYTSIDTKPRINGNLWDLNYLLATGKTTVTSPKGRISFVTEDTYGKVTAIQSAGYLPLQYAYDTHGRLNTFTQSTRQSTINYDSSGRVASFVDPLSETTSFTYDNAGKILTETLPDLRVIQYTYDFNGNVTSITPPAGTSHSFTQNLFDLLSEYLPPSISGTSTNTQYSYDNDKRLTQILRPDGNSVSLTYDSTKGFLKTVNLPGQTYSYVSSGGFVNSASTSDGLSNSLSYNYDLLSNDGSSVSTYNAQVSYSYNSDRNLSSIVVTSGASSSINYTYDTDTLLTIAGSETVTPDATTGALTGTQLGQVNDSYTYDSTYGELASYSAQYSPTPFPSASASPLPSPSPSTYLSESYTRDALGRISGKIETEGGAVNSYGYTYDATGRLTGISVNGTGVSSYGYDLNSNRISGTVFGSTVTATYDVQDRLSTYNTKTYAYSLNGDLASVTDSSLPSGSQTTSYTFDELGNLKQVVLPAKTISYLVDAFNRRVAKKSGTTIVARYVYRDQTRIEALQTAAGSIAQRFVWGAKLNVPDYMIASGINYKLISDERGSIRFVVNASTGAIAQQIEYDEFGNVLSDTNPGFQPFYFAGCLYDTDTKLCHFGVRDYDASTGRWLSKDPILFYGGDTNLYGYTWNDPINWVDSAGLRAGSASGTYSSGPADEPGLQSPLLDPTDLIGIGLGAKAGYTAADEIAWEAFRKGGFLNSNQYLRIGFSRLGGDRVFRIAGDLVPTDSGHIIIKNLGPLTGGVCK